MVNQEVAKEIRRAVDTGKVAFGAKSTESTLLVGECRAVVVSANAPKLLQERLREYCTLASVPLVQFDGTSRELGEVCGKPFLVSSMTVSETGQSKLLNVIKSE